MTYQKLLEELGNLFDKDSVRRIVAAFRNNPLLWKELSAHDLPAGWVGFAGSQTDRWNPGLLSLAYIDSALFPGEFQNLNLPIPAEMNDRAVIVLETVRMTGLEPANLRDAASLAFTLRQYRTENQSWQGLTAYLLDGKSTLSSWKTALLALPWLCPDSDAALEAITMEESSLTEDEIAELIVDLIKSMPYSEKEQFSFLTKTLERAAPGLQVAVLSKLQGHFSDSLLELLANSFLVQQTDKKSETDFNDPQDLFENYQNLAMLSQFSGKPAKARQELDQAVAVIKRSQAGQLRRLALEFETINPEEARKLWEQILQLEPDNPSHRREYAEFLVKQNEPDFALDLINQHPDEATTALLALRYPELREHTDEVIETLDNALSRKNLPDYHSRFESESDNFKAAEYAFARKKYNVASDFIHKALKEKPNDIESIRLAARVDQRLANLDAAIESTALLATFEPENKENNKELARLYMQTQQDGRALEVYENIIANKNLVEREDFLTYSEIAIKAGKPELAIPVAESYLNKDRLDGEALVLLSRALISANQKQKAVDLLERASAVAPEKPTSWISLARMWIDLGDQDQAKLALRKAKAALPGEPRILTALGKLYLENEETTDAISVLRQAHQSDPENRTTIKLLAEAWLKQGYLNEAWDLIAPLEDDYASDPELALILGKVALANEEEDTAQTMLKFAWQSLKRDDALEAYTSSLLKLDEKHPGSNQFELNQLLEAMQSRQPAAYANFDLLMLTSDLKAANGMFEEAYSDYLGLLDDPQAKAPRAYHHLQLQIGKTASKLGLQDIALASLQEAMLINPDHLNTRHILAKAYLDSGLDEEALNTARAALQIAPSDVENILWFSEFMNARGNEKESVQVLKDALHLRPDNQSLYLTLARTQARMDDLPETKATLNRMLELDSITTKVYIDVANLYLNLNETEEASAVIMKAISDNPSPDFDLSRDLVYSVLRLGDASAALHLVDDLEDSLGTHPCYLLLLSDIQVANRQFIAALENLRELHQRIEFAEDKTCFNSQRFGKSGVDFPPYNIAGLYDRMAQLERVTGDLLAAQKHADLAQKEDLEMTGVIVLQAGLALSLRNSKKLEQAFDLLNPDRTQDQAMQAIARVLAFDAAIQNDDQKLSMLWEYFISKDQPSLFQDATAALLALRQKAPENAIQKLKTAKPAPKMENGQVFNIEQHFDQIWAGLMTFLAAWEARDWTLANTSMRQSLNVVRVNPIANQLLAAYLADNQRQYNNAMLLHITRHIPELYAKDDPLSLLEDQVALAGRFLKPSSLLPDLKQGQAVFSGRWDDEEDMAQLILNPRQAASVISVLVDPVRKEEVMKAFGSDSEVRKQKAIAGLHADPASTAKTAEELLRSHPDDPTLHALLAFALREEPEKAAQAMEAALAIWNDEPEWHAFASNMYQDAGDYPKAAAHLEDALRISPKTAHYWQLLGDVKLLEKDYHAAKDYFGKASDLFPTNPEALDSLAKINQKLGEHQVAIQCWQKAHQVDPQNPVYKTSIAESQLARKEFEQAIETADQVLFSTPGHPDALLIIAKAQMQSDKHAQAIQTIQYAKKIVPDTIPFDLLGIEIEARNKPGYAIKATQTLAETHPVSAVVLNKLANYQIEANLLDKAQVNLINSLAVEEDNAETLILLGKIARLQGHLDQAIARLSQAIQLDPSQIEAYLEMGQTYQDRREVANAIEIYHKAIDMIEKDPRPYVQAAAAYKESRDYRNAEYMLRQAAQLSPSDQSIRRQLAAIVALNLVNNLQEAPKRR